MTATAPGRSPQSRWLAWVGAAGAIGLLLGPALGPGYLLVRDMVFVPRPPITGRLLGLWSETPRAVPSDLVVALASHVLPGSLVQILVLIGLLMAAGTGAARLAGSGLPGTVAAVAAIWNPYVVERLGMGHWALLFGYAALPWVVLGLTGRMASGGPWRALAGALGLGAVGGAAAMVLVGLALLGTVLANLATASGRARVRRLVLPIGLYVALCLPWAVPSLLRTQTGSDTAGFRMFAPAADTAYGVVVSVLTGGGVWNSEVVPPGRGTVAGALGGLLMVALALAGVVLRRQVRAIGELASTAALGLICVAVSALPAAASLAGIPGGGLLRDGARESAPWVLLVAVGLGLLTGRLLTGHVPVLPYAALLLPVAVLPVAGWGVGGELRPTTYPQDVLAAARMINASPREGGVVVLPFTAYRTYAWNDERPSLPPWTRLLNRPVATSTDLDVQRGAVRVRVAGEDAWAAEVGAALASTYPAAALPALGVRWVVVDASTGRPPAGSSLVSRGPDVALYRLDGGSGSDVDDSFDAADVPPRSWVLAGDLSAVIALGLALRPRRRASADLAGDPATMR